MPNRSWRSRIAVSAVLWAGILAFWNVPAGAAVGAGVSPPFHLDTTGLASADDGAAGGSRMRLEVFPNPFRSETMVRCGGVGREALAITIHDASGKEIAALPSAPTDAGPRAIVWNGEDAAGRRVPAGVYFVRARAGNAARTDRLVVVR